MKSDFTIQNIAIKIASRCNLNCRYCYIYNRGDKSYLEQPKLMSKLVYTTLIDKIQDYCFANEITNFRIILFGGEPLLAGKEYIKELVTTFRETLEPDIKLSFGMQTNGTLIDKEWIDIFKKLKVGFGISLDGNKEINDLNRVDFKEQGSYDKIMENLEILHKNDLKPGFISFLNIAVDPIEAYEHFKSIRADSVDFLFPDANFYQLPAGLNHREDNFDWSNTPYGDWYIKLFDKWFDDPKPKPRIRYLDYILQLILGNDVGYDLAGMQNTNLVIVESNGDIEAVDDLRVCGDGFTKSAINILTHTLYDAEMQPLIKLHNTSKHKLAKQCLACPAKEVCGSNYLPTRYGKKNGFNNPSVYCPDLLKIITHIRNRVIDELNAEETEISNILEKMTYSEAIDSIVAEMNEPLDVTEYEAELISFR